MAFSSLDLKSIMADAGEEEEKEGSEAKGEAKTPEETSITKIKVIGVRTNIGIEATKDAWGLEVAVVETIIEKDKLSTVVEILEIIGTRKSSASPTSMHEAIS